jgi:hypothetical protein
MNLRHLRTFAAAATVATSIILPAMSAHAAYTCTPVAGPVGTSNTGSGAPVRQGVCIPGSGYVEAGTDGTHTYVVLSSDANGYVGVSNFSNTADSNPCGPSTPDGSEGGSGTNAGGCYGTNDVQVNVGAVTGGLVPLPVCGQGTGQWYSSSRNGCRVDNEDINQGVARALAILACIQANPANLPFCVL